VLFIGTTSTRHKPNQNVNNGDGDDTKSDEFKTELKKTSVKPTTKPRTKKTSGGTYVHMYVY